MSLRELSNDELLLVSGGDEMSVDGGGDTGDGGTGSPLALAGTLVLVTKMGTSTICTYSTPFGLFQTVANPVVGCPPTAPSPVG